MAQDKSSKRSKRTKTTTKKRDRIENVGVIEKLPSNAPTMAIAPSDYEHIYHEGHNAGQANQNENQQAEVPKLSPRKSPQTQRATVSPPVSPQIKPTVIAQREVVAVTPDGYTYLGQPEANGQKQALPPYIVRASNQFSRAALARVARYLASRAI